MRRKRQFKARLLSLFLAVLLLTGNVFIVKAQEMSEVGTQPEAAEEDVNQLSDSLEDLQADSKEPRTGFGMTVTLQIEAYGETLEQGIQVSMPDTYKTFAEYGLTGVEEPEQPGYTVLHVLAEYCEQQYGEKTAASLISAGGGYVSGFLDLPRKSTIMFLKNHKSLQVGAQQEKIQAGDLVSVVDIWANSNWSEGGQYSWFETKHMTAEAGVPLSMKLNVEPLMWNEAARLSGAVVKVLDQKGNVAAEGRTDNSGRVSMVVGEPGTYTVTAERKSGYYDTDSSNPWDLVPPHGTLVVAPGKELTDKEAVEKAGELLENQLSGTVDLSQITEDFELPGKGSYQTDISWKSSDTKCININGTQAKVMRPVGADKTVTLTAVITRNTGKAKEAAQTVKEIPVTVAGKPLFTDLFVDHGTLKYDKSINTYTVYAKNDVEKLTISGTAAEGVSVVKCTVIDTNGTSKQETKITVSDPKFQTESYLTLTDDRDLTPQEIMLETVGTTAGKVTITVKRGNPGPALPDLPDITWGQHLGDKNNNALVDAKTPAGEGELLWESFSNAPDNWGSVYAGTPVLVNGSIYAVRNNKIEMLDAKTGKVKASTLLYANIGYYSNIIYGGGMIFVPLGNGMVQCFNASTLKSMYLLKSPEAAIGSTYNVNGAMHYEDGRLYAGYSDGAFTNPVGCYAAYDTMDLDIDNETEPIEPLWVTENASGQSYYGSGAVTVDGKVIVAGDSGMAYVYDGETGQELSSCQLDGQVRGSLVYAEGFVWAATQAGKVYKLSMDSAGKLDVTAKGSLPLSTNASPVVVSGKVYITGGTFDNGGFVAVYDMDLKLLAKEKTKYALNTPTVTTAYDNVYVYFSENGPDGSLYMAEVTGNNKITITKVYTPKHKQYSMSKVVAGADGTLYYSNDAGYLYAVRAKSAQTPETPGGSQSTGGLRLPSNGSWNLPQRNLSNKPKTVRVNAAGNKKSSDESLVEAIIKSVDKKENSLTVNHPPEIVGAEVFAELAKHPEFRLVFNCGTYTLSIKGSEVTNTEASLTTKLVEINDGLSKEEAEKYGNYQQFALIQEGAFPGNITVVYKLGGQFADAKNVYLYDMTHLEEAKETVWNKPYDMFVLEQAGIYILSDIPAEGTEVTATAYGEIDDSMVPKNKGEKTKSGLPVWAYLLIGAGAGALIGGMITVSVIHTRRKRETWEK